jgi:uridylate kinase
VSARPGYSRALVKLSGNAFVGVGKMGIGEEEVRYITTEVSDALKACPELAVVVGGGNIMRGASFCAEGKGRLRADSAGMLATIVNALVLQDGLANAGVETRVYSGLPVPDAAAPFDYEQAREDLQDGRVVLLAGGTGNPLFTTDTAAALRAIQLGAEVVLKATRVEGVHSADPEKNQETKFFSHLSCEEVLARRLEVMDLCAVSLCMKQNLPVRVLNYRTPGNIRRALAGESIGTLIGNERHGHG